jgi:hypothetical protein
MSVILQYVLENGTVLKELVLELPIYPLVGHRVCLGEKTYFVKDITWHIDECPATRKQGRIEPVVRLTLGERMGKPYRDGDEK